ncbi:unnamed protein product [Lactuca saligna]|uniref:Uncharacterized protein n=1 Tax=Lactuca saligna TaxID=75948 RepID=A0AA35YVD1_LACSI|nr:unnamed protein product [Lactuca saligna]
MYLSLFCRSRNGILLCAFSLTSQAVPSGLSVINSKKCNKTSIELGLPLFQSSEVTLYPFLMQYLQSDLLEPKSVRRLIEVFGEISPINSHKDRSFVSLVCKDWYNAEWWSRRHVFIRNDYSVPPKIVARRIPQIRSVTLKGKPRFPAFNLVPEDWGADVHPWLSVLAKAYPFLEELRLKRLTVCYSLQGFGL